MPALPKRPHSDPAHAASTMGGSATPFGLGPFLRTKARTGFGGSILGGAFTWRIMDAITAHVTAGSDHADAHSIELIHSTDAEAENVPDGAELDEHYVTDERTGDVGMSGVLAVSRGWSSRTSIGVQLRDEREIDVGKDVVGNGILTSNTFQGSVANQRGAYAEETMSYADRLSLTAAPRAEGPAGLFGRATEGLPRFAASWTPLEDGGDALRVHAAYGRTSNLPVAQGFTGLQTTTTGLVVPVAEPPIPEFTSEYEAGMARPFCTSGCRFRGPRTIGRSTTCRSRLRSIHPSDSAKRSSAPGSCETAALRSASPHPRFERRCFPGMPT